MIEPGLLFEERAILHDLLSRIRSLKSTLPYYDRKQGKAISQQTADLREDAQKRVEQLPDGPLRSNLTREIYA